jgi:preprotein translocase subunit SecG
MYGVLIGLIIVVCILLVLVVLAQNSKGGGLSSQFGGAGTQLMGVKRTGDLLEKLTWGFAIALLSLSLMSNFILPKGPQEGEEIKSINVERAADAPIIPQQNQLGPQQGAQPTEEDPFAKPVEEGSPASSEPTEAPKE